jgi:hypothetical protein
MLGDLRSQLLLRMRRRLGSEPERNARQDDRDASQDLPPVR